ncbi:hypothetical protein OUZ56_027857 [Daphnia magna]|uniref:Uncharacterized protein n=1 Tax=Daphnia magna TaxID=35525 RepID=A0ABR0B2C6_9CRUS|nr:hypothetical protein OUZ56_027857 [Daphnia magna]
MGVAITLLIRKDMDLVFKFSKARIYPTSVTAGKLSGFLSWPIQQLREKLKEAERSRSAAPAVLLVLPADFCLD